MTEASPEVIEDDLGKMILISLNNGEMTEEDAFAQIDRLYRDDLFHYIKSMVSDADIAADILQETMFGLFKCYKNLKITSGSLKYYLLRAAQNNSRCHLGKNRLEIQSSFPNLEGMIPTRRAGTDEWQEEWRGEQSQRIKLALEELEPEDRQVLLESYFHGASSNELADAIGISPAAVRKRLQRARKYLHAAIIKNALASNESTAA